MKRRAPQRRATPPRLVVVLSGPSAGVGKTTVVNQLLRKRQRLTIVPGTTTRPRQRRRGGDRDHIFVTAAQFKRLAKQGRFLETAKVVGHWYGTDHRTLERIWKRGHVPFIVPEVRGHAQIRRAARRGNYRVCSIFLVPGSFAELRQRMLARQPDINRPLLARRLALARREIKRKGEYDVVVVNREGQLNRAVRDALRFVDSCLARR